MESFFFDRNFALQTCVDLFSCGVWIWVFVRNAPEPEPSLTAAAVAPTPLLRIIILIYLVLVQSADFRAPATKCLNTWPRLAGEVSRRLGARRTEEASSSKESYSVSLVRVG